LSNGGRGFPPEPVIRNKCKSGGAPSDAVICAVTCAGRRIEARRKADAFCGMIEVQ
jgi:hypothetical protein